MNYIYNIALNFQKNFVDFFEWNLNDNIIYINKIPIFKVSNYDFNNIKNMYVQFDKNFMRKIYRKTEMTKKQSINHAFLISNGKNTLGIKLNKNGFSHSKSSLILKEEAKISNIVNNLNKKQISYKIIKINEKDFYLTRKEKKVKTETIKKLNSLFKNNENEKLKYLFFECYNKQEENTTKIYNQLKKEIKNNSPKCTTIYNFFKLVEQIKKG